MSSLKVLIAGAGLGGLTLAQSLDRSGIDFQIFERDANPLARFQGYRLHLDADAINAAREVLTPDLYATFEATSFRTEPYTTILRQDLAVIKRLFTEDEHGEGVWPIHDGPPIHANVDRATLRQILLAGLSDKIHFGKTLERYEQHRAGVTAYFSDGTSVNGDVLVGADGIRSAVRRQRAPHADTVDAGITAIYGRVSVESAKGLVPIETLQDIFTIATDDRKIFLCLGSVQFPTRPDEAAKTLAAPVKLRAQDDYVVCIVGGRHQYFPEDLGNASSDALQRIAAELLLDWPGCAPSLVMAGDPAAFFSVEMFTSVPCVLDAPTNVTLMGDAIHAMTPTLGRGANLAMRDGALLGRQLELVAAGRASLANALFLYERDMLEYGFKVVREAVQMGQLRMAQNPLPVA